MTFIVAEIGVNWDGNPLLLENMIKNAKKAGCNAVKFQSFDEKIVKDHPEASHLLKSSVSESNIELINSIAKKITFQANRRRRIKNCSLRYKKPNKK